jgi:hypothetical protein
MDIWGTGDGVGGGAAQDGAQDGGGEYGGEEEGEGLEVQAGLGMETYDVTFPHETKLGMLLER